MLVSIKDQGADSPREAFVQSVFARFQEAGGEDKRLLITYQIPSCSSSITLRSCSIAHKTKHLTARVTLSSVA